MKAKSAPTIRLTVRTFDKDGRQLSEEIKTNDIFLWNWAVFIAQWLKAAFAADLAGQYQFTTVPGVATNTQAGGVSCAEHFYGIAITSDTGQSPWANTAFVQVGSGNNTPLISDFTLQTFVAEATPTMPDIVFVGNVLKIIFSTTFSFTEETVCGETAIRMAGGICPSSTANRFIITRDIFTPVTVPMSGTISIQHELWFNGTP
jgi:hypothetical protein